MMIGKVFIERLKILEESADGEMTPEKSLSVSISYIRKLSSSADFLFLEQITLLESTALGLLDKRKMQMDCTRQKMF